MSQKIIELAGIGSVTLVKRAQNRSIRLSVTASGVRVSMPKWTPFSAGEVFAINNLGWIQQEITKISMPLIEGGQRIGKLHYLRFEQALNKRLTASRVTGTEIVVRMQQGEAIADSAVQKRAQTAALRALKREAEQLLPPRVQNLAAAHNRDYKSISIKQLKRRWGSCDSHQALTFNFFLMELPWEHIDYVILHELAHTVEMNHGPAFWHVLTAMEPRARMLSKQLRSHQPAIGTWHTVPSSPRSTAG
ncbi:MAG TPA: SprT family zinc-dependent metalloprotease [Candidatus Saccharimonadia bacterium]|nr:SprT family zinc-dependent metalloprotease [Candidatus Saccharimonadia bacterium]